MQVRGAPSSGALREGHLTNAKVLALLKIHCGTRAPWNHAGRAATLNSRRSDRLSRDHRGPFKFHVPHAGSRSDQDLEGTLAEVSLASSADKSLSEPQNGTILPQNGDQNGAHAALEADNGVTAAASGVATATSDGATEPFSLPKAPWNIATTITVMMLWLICFYIAAYDVVPFMLRMLGYGTAAAAAQPGVQALRHLLLDATQLSMTLFLLRQALGPHSPRSLGLFAVRLRPLRSWVPTVVAGIAAFPLVDFIHKQMVNLLSTSSTTPVSNAAFVGNATWEVRATWFLVLAVCAPLWEEIMFRGFLLPSLARYLSPGWAVAASSLVFATVHFTKEGFLPLLLLGGVFGAAYLKTLNLVPAVALHSLWNICLLAQILMTG